MKKIHLMTLKIQTSDATNSIREHKTVSPNWLA